MRARRADWIIAFALLPALSTPAVAAQAIQFDVRAGTTQGNQITPLRPRTLRLGVDTAF